MCKVGTGPTFPLQCFSALFPIDGWSPVCHLLALVILSEYCLSRKVEKWRELEGFSIQSRQKHVLEDHGRYMDKGNGSDIAGINSYWDTFSPNRWMIPPIGSVHLLTWGGGFVEYILSIKPLPMQWRRKNYFNPYDCRVVLDRKHKLELRDWQVGDVVVKLVEHGNGLLVGRPANVHLLTG